MKTKFTIKTKKSDSESSPGVIEAVFRKYRGTSTYLEEEDVAAMKPLMDLQGYVHPAYGTAANLLEYSTRKLAATTDAVLQKWQGVSHRKRLKIIKITVVLCIKSTISFFLHPTSYVRRLAISIKSN